MWFTIFPRSWTDFFFPSALQRTQERPPHFGSILGYNLFRESLYPIWEANRLHSNTKHVVSQKLALQADLQVLFPPSHWTSVPNAGKKSSVFEARRTENIMFLSKGWGWHSVDSWPSQIKPNEIKPRKNTRTENVTLMREVRHGYQVLVSKTAGKNTL
jgi:hypothetical protein